MEAVPGITYSIKLLFSLFLIKDEPVLALVKPALPVRGG